MTGLGTRHLFLYVVTGNGSRDPFPLLTRVFCHPRGQACQAHCPGQKCVYARPRSRGRVSPAT